MPVLSNTTYPRLRAPSIAPISLTSIPFFAASVVDIDVTVGIARPSACGHVITKTEIVRVSANTMPSSVNPAQKKKVRTPTIIAVSVR